MSQDGITVCINGKILHANAFFAAIHEYANSTEGVRVKFFQKPAVNDLLTVTLYRQSGTVYKWEIIALDEIDVLQFALDCDATVVLSPDKFEEIYGIAEEEIGNAVI